MMKPSSLQNLFVLLFALVLLPVALASDGDGSRHVRFTWTVGERPAMIALPLPANLAIAAVERVSLAGAPLAGIGLVADPPRLELYLQPVPGDILTFSTVDIRFDSGLERRFEFGYATVVSLAAQTGQLEFRRSLAAPGAGLYQAVALRNSGERELTVTSAHYLPAPLREGRLLVATGETLELLARLEASMSPARRREARRAGDEYPLVRGFEWRDAADIGLTLAGGESAVLVWSDAALPSVGATTSFDLRPVIDYRIEAGAVGRQLGLPVTVRRQP